MINSILYVCHAQDLLAYLQRITLCCHQLKMCAKVKAEVQNISGEMIVSGLDSATSLIQVNIQWQALTMLYEHFTIILQLVPRLPKT